MELPKFAVMEENKELEYWTCNLVRDTYDKALSEKDRLEGKGCENLYVVGLAFIVGPKDRHPDAELLAEEDASGCHEP